MVRALLFFVVVSLILDFVLDRKYYPDHKGFRTEIVEKLKKKRSGRL